MNNSMIENMALIRARTIDALKKTDLEYIRWCLNHIDEPTIVTGVGGSSVVSEFAAKVLRYRNKIITDF